MNPAEFAQIAAAEDRMWWFRGMREIAFRLLDPLARARRYERVLEAGCGTGHFCRALAARYGWRMVPADLAPEGLDYARLLGVERLVRANVDALPFRDASFDAVLSMDVIVHFPAGGEAPALAEMARVLVPGGLLVLRVSALDLLRSRHSMYVGERQRFTRRRLLQAVSSLPIRVRRCSYLNSLLLPVALAKFRLWEPLTGAPPASGVEVPPAWLNELLHLPLAAEAAWLGAGLDFPAGQSIILIGERT